MGNVTTQYGLQAAFRRARQSIFVANLPATAIIPDGTYLVCSGGASAQQIADAVNAADNAVLSQSFLRLIQPLTTNLNLFSWPVQVDQPTVNPGEIRLQKQDALFGGSAAFYLAKGASASDVSYTPMTYPNPITWPNASGAGGLYTVYNGNLKVTINKSVIVPNYPMLPFMQIPQTQLTGATNTPGTQFDPSQVQLLEPTINLIGTKQNVWQVELPANMTAASFEANTLGIWYIFGVLAQNVTLFT